MKGRLGCRRSGVEGGREKREWSETTKCRGGDVASASLHSLRHVTTHPSSSSSLGVPEIVPLAQAWEQAQGFAFALGGCSVLEFDSRLIQWSGMSTKMFFWGAKRDEVSWLYWMF